MKIKCIHCGKLFQPATEFQDLCSKPCKTAWLDRPRPPPTDEERKAARKRKRQLEQEREDKRIMDNLKRNLERNPNGMPVLPKDLSW
jgi:predicted  nucleic acid-binding Zn-ribbon protein